MTIRVHTKPGSIATVDIQGQRYEAACTECGWTESGDLPTQNIYGGAFVARRACGSPWSVCPGDRPQVKKIWAPGRAKSPADVPRTLTP